MLSIGAPTRDGNTEMAFITSLPSRVQATTVAELYRRRWTIETLFAHVERNLHSEIAALGYPRATLFGFGVALVAANVFAVAHAAMEAAKASAPEVADIRLGDFAIVEEARAVQRGMDVMLDDDAWEPFHTMAPRSFAKRLSGRGFLRAARKIRRRKMGHASRFAAPVPMAASTEVVHLAPHSPVPDRVFRGSVTV